MKTIDCILIEESDDINSTEVQQAIAHTSVVLKGDDVVKNRHGKITAQAPDATKMLAEIGKGYLDHVNQMDRISERDPEQASKASFRCSSQAQCR